MNLHLNNSGKGYCPRKQRLSPITNGLSRLVDVKPKVKEDFLAVEEQFPCNTFAFLPLEQFVSANQLKAKLLWSTDFFLNSRLGESNDLAEGQGRSMHV